MIPTTFTKWFFAGSRWRGTGDINAFWAVWLISRIVMLLGNALLLQPPRSGNQTSDYIAVGQTCICVGGGVGSHIRTIKLPLIGGDGRDSFHKRKTYWYFRLRFETSKSLLDTISYWHQHTKAKLELHYWCIELFRFYNTSLHYSRQQFSMCLL